MKHLRMLTYIVLVFGIIIIFSSLLAAPRAGTLSELEFVTYDNVLYTPEEIRLLSEDEQAAGHVGWDYDYYATDFSRVRTNRILMHLTPGETYGLYTEQLTYAAKIWVDGHLMAVSGTVSETEEGFVPRTGSVTIYFTAGEETEIVMQRCNFCHAKWNAVQFYLGPQAVITRQVQNAYFSQTMYLGFLAAMGILNLGMFMGMPGRRRYLWFSLGCFAILIHESLLDPKLIMIVFPNLNWTISYRAESISLALLIIFLVLFMRSCFEQFMWKWADRIVIGVLCALILITLILPTSVYTRYTVEAAVTTASLVGAYLLLLLIRALIHRKTLLTSQWYYLAGLGVFIITAAMAVLGIGPRHVNLIQVGMILFEMTITLALALEFLDLQKAYLASRQKEEQLRAMNTSMEQTKELQDNFMAIMNHEMRTPLTVIAGYADLSVRKLEKQNPRDENTIRNLELVKAEALRLGRIVEKSEEGARGIMTGSSLETAEMRHLLEDARDFCRPICEKRDNRILIDCPEGLKTDCMRDSVLQALYNLILNASRHTHHGTIRLTAGENGAEILLSVADNGEGMDEETRQRAFERGFSRDGGHGLGLALCREVAERHGGWIRITGNEEGGTTVTLALPVTGDGNAQA